MSSFNYTYDPVSNRTQVVESNGVVVSWTYDPTYQLTNEQRSGANSYNISYTYDAVGNRTLMLNSGATTTYTYNAANELATSQTSAGRHDQHLRWQRESADIPGTGKPVDDEHLGRRESPDSSGVALAESLTRSYTMATASGCRSKTQRALPSTSGMGRTSCWRPTAATSSRLCTLWSLSVYGNLISQSRGGERTHSILFDAVGSTRAIDEQHLGSVTDSYLYDSFGNLLLASGLEHQLVPLRRPVRLLL